MALFALRDFARLPNPSHSLSPSTLLFTTPDTLTVFDAYPKAMYHFLVLPKLPFPPAPETQERDLDSLASLLVHPSAPTVLDALAAAADEVQEMVRDEMTKTHGVEWGINVGFHAVPSMRHLHLHIISDDLVSPTLKTKKHYNSFRPDHGFFISLREVQGWIKNPAILEERAVSLKAKDPLLASPLTCFKCGDSFGNIPALKRHLEDEFAREIKR